jgi:hypothetical protein
MPKANCFDRDCNASNQSRTLASVGCGDMMISPLPGVERFVKKRVEFSGSMIRSYATCKQFLLREKMGVDSRGQVAKRTNEPFGHIERIFFSSSGDFPELPLAGGSWGLEWCQQLADQQRMSTAQLAKTGISLPSSVNLLILRTLSQDSSSQESGT